ncbi:MAG: methyltransferase domain-containing protein [Clostridium sp.]
MDKQTKWDSRYLDKDFLLEGPDRFLIDSLSLLSKGSVLDLASGDGRNSIYLAKNGFNVTAVDFSIEALKRLEKFANNEDITVKTALCDITNPKKLSFLGKFNNILISHYKVDDNILPTLEKMLHSGGSLIYYTFNEEHHRATGFNHRFCLKKNELKDKLNLTLSKYESIKVIVDNSSIKHLDGYIFTK